jgi:hypothetical protein
MAGKRPWVLVSYSPDETARCLLLQTGSVQKSREAITRNADVLKWPKRDMPDVIPLLGARRYQRKKNCSDNAALVWAADKLTTAADWRRPGHRDHDRKAKAAASLVRQLRRTLRGKTLAEFARHYPEWMQPMLRSRPVRL